MCGETKGLEEFAKAQRSRRDHAVKQPLYTLDFGGANLLSGQKCMKCMQEQLDMEPIDESKYDNPEAAVISESDSYYVNYELGGSVASEYVRTLISFANWCPDCLKLTDFSNGSTTDDDTENEFNTWEEVSRKDGTGNRNGVALGGSSWAVQKTKSWKSSSLTSSSNVNSIIGGSSTICGFDPKSYGHPSRSTSHAPSTAGSSLSFTTNVTEQSDTTTGRGGWAKIPAYKPPKPEPEDEDESDSDDEWKKKDDDTDSDGSETDL